MGDDDDDDTKRFRAGEWRELPMCVLTFLSKVCEILEREREEEGSVRTVLETE